MGGSCRDLKGKWSIETNKTRLGVLGLTPSDIGGGRGSSYFLLLVWPLFPLHRSSTRGPDIWKRGGKVIIEVASDPLSCFVSVDPSPSGASDYERSAPKTILTCKKKL